MNLPPELTQIQVVVTHSCRRICGYCYNKKLFQSTVPEHTKVIESLVHALNLVASPIVVEVIGGEPLDSEIIQLTEDTLRIAHSHSQCSKTILCTAVCEPTRIQSLLSNVNYIYLSIDPSIHEHNAKKINNRKLSQVVEIATKHDIGLSVSAVLSGDETQAELKDFIDHLAQAGINKVGFDYPSIIPLSSSEIQNFVEQFYWLYQLRLAYQDVIEIHGMPLKNIDLYITGYSRICYCTCGRNTVVIEPNGEITMGLCFDHTKEIPADWRVLREQLDVRQMNLQNSEPCQSCNLWNVCYGGCSARGESYHTGTAGRDRTACDILRGIAYFVDQDRQHLVGEFVNSLQGVDE